MNDSIEWWWLSYACEERGFLGVVIILAPSFADACKISTLMQLSPGGQVQGASIDNSFYKHITLNDCFCLLSKERATELTELIDNE